MAQTAGAEREAALVAGYAELEFAGFLTVSAADEETLERSCAEYEQAAAQAGLELRALHGRHDLGVVCALPIGRRSEEHTSELQSLMSTSYAVFCLTKNNPQEHNSTIKTSDH